jgi:hypothetical protein
LSGVGGSGSDFLGNGIRVIMPKTYLFVFVPTVTDHLNDDPTDVDCDLLFQHMIQS